MEKGCKYYLPWREAERPIPIDECYWFGWGSGKCKHKDNQEMKGKLCPWQGYPEKVALTPALSQGEMG